MSLYKVENIVDEKKKEAGGLTDRQCVLQKAGIWGYHGRSVCIYVCLYMHEKKCWRE